MISLHQVSKKYETPAGAFAALRDVDISAGEFVGVVGKYVFLILTSTIIGVLGAGVNDDDES